MRPRAIVLVTGATTGVGFGLCCRLLDQLCSPEDAHDAFLSSFGPRLETGIKLPLYDTLTLILPCRSLQRGQRAKTRMLELVKRTAKRLERSNSSDHAQRFLTQLEIDVLYCDLAIIQTVVDFASVVTQRYPYVSHIVNNAGLGTFTGVDLLKGINEFCINPVRAVTVPTYKTQAIGKLSVDGLGLVWQCNVFGHFVMFRLLAPLLQSTPYPISRVLWMSSLEAHVQRVDPSDWQLIRTSTSYEGSKSQTDLVCLTLDRDAALTNIKDGQLVRHVLVHPGVASTDILGAKHIGIFLNWVKLFSFYFARLLGSQNHTITPYNSGVSAVHALTSPIFDSDTAPFPYARTTNDFEAAKFASKTDVFGHPYVVAERVNVAQLETEKLGQKLVAMMDTLYQSIIREGATKAK